MPSSLSPWLLVGGGQGALPPRRNVGAVVMLPRWVPGACRGQMLVEYLIPQGLAVGKSSD